MFVTATPEAEGFVFRPAGAVLQVGSERFTGRAGHEFGQWDAAGRPVKEGGRWEHRPVGDALALVEPGRRHLLSVDFDTPAPSPECSDIALDLSRALASPRHPALPPIRFAPVRWQDGYT